jgi:hypothetical protein
MKTAKNFMYLGHHFTPVRQFAPDEQEQPLSLMGLRSIGFSNYTDFNNAITSEWDYEEFYGVARKKGAGEIDVFLLDRKTYVVPATNELFKYENA